MSADAKRIRGAEGFAPSEGNTGRTSLFVWLIWSLMTVLAVGLVAVFGHNIPINDEMMATVPLLVGEVPVSVESLLAPHINHHLAVPRVIILVLDRVWGHDFRAGMYFSVLIASAVSALLIQTAKAVRGQAHVADSIFPVLLLNWGHAINYLWCFQMALILATVLTLVVLALIVRYPRRPPVGALLAAAACLLAMPVSFGSGVAITPVLSLWLIAAGVGYWNISRRTTVLTILIGILCICVGLWAYVPNPDFGLQIVVPLNLWGSIRKTFMVMSLSYGPLMPGGNSISMYPQLAVFTGGVVLMSVVVCLRACTQYPEERLRAWGLALLLTAISALGVGIAGSRGDPLVARYSILVTPVVACVYFIWMLYGRLYPRTFWTAAIWLGVFFLVPHSSRLQWTASLWIYIATLLLFAIETRRNPGRISSVRYSILVLLIVGGIVITWGGFNAQNESWSEFVASFCIAVTLLVLVDFQFRRRHLWGLGVTLAAAAAFACALVYKWQAIDSAVRHTLLLAPVLCGIYLTCCLPERMNPQTCFCLSICAVVFVFALARTWDQYRWADSYSAKLAAFEKDVRSQLPLSLLLARHGPGVYEFPYLVSIDDLRQRCRRLHDAGFEVFKELNVDETNVR